MATTPLTIELDTDKVTEEVRAYIDKKFREMEAEVERLRPIVLAAIAWREWFSGRLVDLMHAGTEETALIAAVDPLDTAGTAPAAGGEADR